MKLIESASKWGNLYRRRYYVDGKRVTEAEFDAHMFDGSLDLKPHHEATAFGYRTTWETNDGSISDHH